MKNSNLFIKHSCMILVLLIACMGNLSAQNDLSGYTYLGQGYGSHYYLSDCEATWEEANEAAMEMGGYLATLFNHIGENTFIGNLVSYRTGIESDDEFAGAWIGLRGVNGNYEWANGEPVGDYNWNEYSPTEPVYADGAALIGDGVASDYTWGDFNWTTYPVTGEAEYIVEFLNQPNCSTNPSKTYVCHNGNTICIGVTALQGHLDHGDLEGPCGPCNTNAMQALPDETEGSEGHALEVLNMAISESKEEFTVDQGRQLAKQIHIYPNPASEQIQVILPEVGLEGTLRILSLTGQEIYRLPLVGQKSLTIDLSAYSSGLYLIDVRSTDGHYQKKMVKL